MYEHLTTRKRQVFFTLAFGVAPFLLLYYGFVFAGRQQAGNIVVVQKAITTNTLSSSQTHKVEIPANPCNSDKAYKVIMDKLPPFGSEPQFQKFGKQGGLYSAYLDAREPFNRVLRIIGMLTNDFDAFCHLISTTTDGNTRMDIIKATMYDIQGSFPDEMQSTVVVCDIEEDSPVPDRVVLSHDRCGAPIASLNVLNRQQEPMKYNFTVCLHKPLFNFTMEDIPRLLEWISVNRVFGGNHFVMYTLPSTDAVCKYLQPLVDAGLLEIHFWNMELTKEESGENHSQKAVINECLYRHMYTSNRITLIDFDEFPTPHSHPTWAQLISHSPCANSSAAYFRNGFFPLQLERDTPHSNLQVNTLQKTQRVNYTFRCHARSKLIVNPRHVMTCSVHSVYRLVGNTFLKKECCMPETLGFLHHYRKLGNFGPVKTTTRDRRMWDFEKKIVESVKDIYRIQNRELPSLV